ncbi:MAG: nickel-dependent hydrogenase large subunit [Bacillota bacterium]|nr:nickel-dependent hydrogenase large subunit [Bacillota bacterium]
MSTKIVLDPLTRMSGFLEIEIAVDKNKVIDAKSHGLLFRGFEKMLEGRSPLDATYFTERICGICSTAHAIASTTALENALNITPNPNSKIIRDLIHSAEFIQNHIRHFYLFSLPDFFEVPNLTAPKPKETSDYRIPDKFRDRLSENYIKSIEFSRLAHEFLALFGGKAPHNHGIFIGGATANFDSSKLITAKAILTSIKDFVINSMLEDANILSEYYSDYFLNGIGHKNVMSYGLYDYKDITYVNPAVSLDGHIFQLNPSNITENIYYAWYDYSSKASFVNNNYENTTPLENPAEDNLSKTSGYTWIKAPRYKGYPVEVGPLARMILSGIYTNGISTMDRIIARALETKKIIECMELLLDKATPQESGQGRYEIPKESKGKGLIDTTRGALGHWIKIKNKVIDSYDVITPSAWNLSPKDSRGVRGVMEEALIGTHIENQQNPVEIGRIIRSFDPCISCATHVVDSNHKPIVSWVI